MPDPVHVEGKKVAHIIIYALSTCGWCRKTKAFLSDMGIGYDYIDVDLLEGGEREKVMNEVSRWNPSRSFPTVVINGAECIVGFQPDKLRKVADE